MLLLVPQTVPRLLFDTQQIFIFAKNNKTKEYKQ
jgi:hypothetical protein